jgi:hypothetical protein
MSPARVSAPDELRAMLARGSGDLGQNRRNLAELWRALGLAE